MESGGWVSAEVKVFCTWKEGVFFGGGVALCTRAPNTSALLQFEVQEILKATIFSFCSQTRHYN